MLKHLISGGPIGGCMWQKFFKSYF